VILAGVAAYFLLWQQNADRAFISAVFGAVSFFLSVRFQVKGRLNQREAERLEEEERRQRAEEELDGEDSEDEDLEDEDFEDDAELSDSEPPQLNEIPAAAQAGDKQRTTNDAPKI
jgi:flagellar biosynthesis/type III secretory pathway M-ring protein FliF/YscJ